MNNTIVRATLLCLIIFLNQALQAQTTIWSNTIAKDGYMSQLENGQILIKDGKELSLLDNITGETLWSSDIKTKEDPQFFDGVPFMYFEGKNYAIIDASTGDIIDQSDVDTKVLDIHYYWDKARIVVELERDKKHHILNIDLNDIKKSWSTELGEMKKELFGLATYKTNNAPAIDAAGTMALVDKKNISYVDVNGTLKNKIEFKKNIKNVGFNPSKEILYILEDKKKLHFINLATTEIVHTTEVKDSNLGLRLLNENNTIAIIQKKNCIMMDALTGDQLGVFKSKDNVKSIYTDKKSGRYYILLKKNITELSVKDASVVQSIDLDTEFQEIKRTKDYVFLFGKNRLNQIDLNDLSLKYAESAKAPPPANYIDIAGGRLYTFQKYGKFYMSFVDADGIQQWNEDYESPRNVEVDVVNDNLLIFNAEEVLYLDPLNGKKLLKKGIKVDPSFTYVVDEINGKYIFYSDKRIVTFYVDENKVLQSKDKMKFKDFDYNSQQPLMIDTHKGLFLKGSNSVYFCDMDGVIKKEMHYKKSNNASGLLKLANTAVTVAAIGTGNAGKVLTVYQNDNLVHKGSMVDGMNGAWDVANQAAAERQAKQNSTSAEYPYVFTKLENKKRGLIFLDAYSGDERFEIVMDEKNPNYIIDEIDGVVFYLNDTTIQAIDIK